MSTEEITDWNHANEVSPRPKPSRKYRKRIKSERCETYDTAQTLASEWLETGLYGKVKVVCRHTRISTSHFDVIAYGPIPVNDPPNVQKAKKHGKVLKDSS